MSLVLARRSFLGTIGLVIAAPAIVRASSVRPAKVLLTNQAPQLTPWPDPTFAARSGTWATYVPRLFFNSTNLARFRANWVDSYFSRIVGVYAGSAGGVIGQMLTYVATGSTTNLMAAYNSAIAQSYSLCPPNPWVFYADYASFVFDWGWPDLTPTQRANLIAMIESNTNLRKTALNTRFQLHEAYYQGYHAWLIGALAIQGEAGATDRKTDLKHGVQNYDWWLAEQSSGFWTSYNYQNGNLLIVEVLWKMATGQDVPKLSGNPSWLAARYENALRNMTPDLLHQYSVDIGDQERRDSGGWQTYPDQAWFAAVAGGFKGDNVANWVASAVTAAGTKSWASPYNRPETTAPVWTVLVYWNRAATQTPPSIGLPLCKAYATSTIPGGGSMGGSWVSFRSGWNLTSGSTDIIAQFYGSFEGPHPAPGPGHLTVQRGIDALLIGAGTYCGSPSNIETHWTSYSFQRNCAVLSPAGSATPDQDGSATLARRDALSDATYPASANLIWYPAWGSSVSATVTGFKQAQGEIYAAVNGNNAWPAAYDPMIYNRYVSFVPASKLFVVRDVYSRPNPGRNRFNWWARSIPTFVGSRAVIKRGSSQATIQCMDPAATLVVFGGVGNEQVIDGVSWPVNAANCQGGKPVANLAAAVAGQGRATFEVAPSTTDVTHAITVGASGTTAPTYTLAQLKALAPMAMAPQLSIAPALIILR
jgi:hypothetical protein